MILLSRPGICAARMMKLSFLTNLLMNGIVDRPLFIMLTTALFSQKDTICFLDQYLPQRRHAIVIG